MLLQKCSERISPCCTAAPVQLHCLHHIEKKIKKSATITKHAVLCIVIAGPCVIRDLQSQFDPEITFSGCRCHQMPCQLMFQILELGEVSSGRGNLVRGCPWCWGSAQFGSVNLHTGANKYSLPYSLPSRQLAVTRAVLPHPHMHVCTFPTQPNMSKKYPPCGNYPPVSCECAIMLKNLFMSFLVCAYVVYVCEFSGK